MVLFGSPEMKNPLNLVVLITGCSAGGMGYYFAEEFASRGCKVYATARRISSMDGLGEKIMRLELDITNSQQCAEVIRIVLAKEGWVDILVNNAGMHCPGK